MAFQRVTRRVHSRRPQASQGQLLPLLTSGLLLAACDLTPVPVQQMGTAGAPGTPSAGAPSAGAPAMETAGSTALGGSGGSGGGAGASSGGTDAGGSAGATPSGGAGGGTAGSGTSGGGGAPAGSGGAPQTNNLVQNGDFSQADSQWHVQAYAGSETHSVMNGAFCVMLSQSASVTIGWPADPASGFAVVDGAGYQFSYQASVTGSPSSLTFSANVGPSNMTGNFTTFSVSGDVPGSASKTFMHPFTAMGATPSAGVAFNVQANGSATVCLDNVTVTKN